MSATPTSPRRRKNDRSEIPVSFLPEGNPAARWAYLFALIGLIPGLGIVFGLPATVLSFIGLRAARRDEEHRGLGHAYVSRIVGPVEFICGILGLYFLARGLDWL